MVGRSMGYRSKMLQGPLKLHRAVCNLHSSTGAQTLGSADLWRHNGAPQEIVKPRQHTSVNPQKKGLVTGGRRHGPTAE